jgi:hypothetical protein
MTRYADGPTAETHTVVHAPVEVVWALVTDIELPARFSSEFAGAAWIDDGPALGARFTGRNQHPAVGEWQTTCTVTQCVNGGTFEWAVGDPDRPSARWRFTLEPIHEGLILRQWMQIGPAPSGLTPAIEAMPDKEERIIARRLGEHLANMQATIDGVKQLAESTAQHKP